MSFYGRIGTIMVGSGTDKLFKNIYGENSVKHMLSGKTVAGTKRAHILTESALLIQQIALSESADRTNNINLELIQKLYKTFLSWETDVDLDIPQRQALRASLESQALRASLESTKIPSQEKFRTARLWLLDIEYIETCGNFIREHPDLALEAAFICH